MYSWLLERLGSPILAAALSVLVYAALALLIAICADLPDHSLRYLEI
jgi:hypothetical protein